MPSVSGGVSTPTSATAAGGEVVSASLEGLVHALDGLKTSLGYDDFATVQSLIGDLRAENLELRSYAETAIREAQKLKEAHDALAEQLAERALEDRVGRAVAETNRLASLADDFDRELAPGRGEEVERAKREAEALRARVGDLEAERADLERRLAAAERRAQEAERRAQEAERRAQDAAASAAVGVAAGAGVAAGTGAALLGASAGARPNSDAAASAACAPTLPPPSPRRGPRGLGSPGHAPIYPAAGFALGASPRASPRASPGPAPTSPAASAALERTTSIRLAELALQNEDLRREVASLSETMFGKTFRPPSAWAEREVRYKRDEQAWAEARRELEADRARLAAELAAARAAEDTDDWRARIAGLEARLLESERERGDLAARLHELQLVARSEPVEFGSEGPRLAGMGASPGRSEARARAAEASADGARRAAAEDLQARLSAVLQERDALRGQLAASVAVVGEATVGAAAAGAAAGGVGPMADESGAGPATSAASVDADARASPRRDAEADAALARSEARLAELHARLEAAEAARRAALAALRAARGGGVKGAAGEGVTQGGAAAGGELAAAEEAGEREPAADPAAEPAAELEAELVRAQEELAGEGVDGPRAEELASRRDGLVARLVGAPAGGAPASSREDEVEPGGATEDGDVATQRLLSALVARAGLQAALAVAEAEAAQLKTGVRPGSGGRGTPRSSPHAAMAQDEGGAASQGSQAHPAQPGAAHQDGAGGAQVAGTLAGTAAQTAAQTVIPQAGGFASASVSRTTTAEQAVSPALAAADRGGAAAPLPAGPASPTGSAASEAARALAADRAAADAAWEDYAASSDLPALKRARAELEARCALLEAQIGKMAGELEEADQDKAEIEARVDAAVRTGDVTPLKEPTPKRTPGAKTGGGKSQGGRARATLGRMFRGLGGGSSKSREASADAEAGRAGGGDAAGVPAKAAAPVVPLAPGEAEEELRAVRAENQMIMEHLVMTKIRMAEMEGDYLESKRALLRAREKQLELTKKLTAVQAAAPALLAPARSTTSAGPLSAAAAGSPPGPQASEVGESGGATPEPATAPSPSPRDSGRSGGSRGLRIPGLA
uniref:Uncharacterized protein n=1 Tax=Auxenochlorella protothecoides TaxID=3075 RepID=A0A1D2AGH1_AUXPR